MKKKTILIPIILLIFVTFTYSANIKNVKQIPNGLLYTDKLASTIYLNSNGNVSEIISSRGCGYYYQLSKDKKRVGFKLINANGFEAPAIINIANRTVKKLHNFVNRCGQVSFSDDGIVAFTIDEELFVIDKNNTKKYDLGYYSNLTPISPNGNFVIFNDDDDQLWLIDLVSSEKEKITNSKGGYFNPIWSPDNKKVIFSGINGDLVVYDLIKKMQYNLGKGNAPDWSADSKNILFSRSEIKNLRVLNSDIFEVNYNGNNLNKLTNTTDIFENTPRYSMDGNSVIYKKKSDNIIYEYSISSINSLKSNNKIVKSKSDILNSSCKVNVKYFPDNNLQNISSLDVPYVHQVYDTPGSKGHCCYAPTTAIMIMAYYNILPKWEVVDNYYGYKNKWGSYVNRRYWFNGNYFNLNVTSSCGGNNYGGYGYMWTNGSPNSNMANYYRMHGMTASQTWSTSWSYTTDEIDAKRPFSMCVFLTGAGHLIVAKGRISGKRSIIFNDPYGDKNTSGYLGYDGYGAIYDWPGYNHGHVQLNDANSSYTPIPWCIKTDFDRIAPADSLVDDLQFDIGFYMKTTSPAKMRYWRDSKSGHNNHYWWTYSMASESDVCYAKWTPNLSESGFYKVLAYVPNVDDQATASLYNIRSLYKNKTVNIDQNEYGNKWVSLGEYFFEKDGNRQIYLGDSTGIENQKIVFDAIKWEKKNVNITAIADSQNGNVPFTIYFIGNASESPEKGNWLWDFGDDSTSTKRNPSHTYLQAGTYDVTLSKFYSSINYTKTMKDYITIDHPENIELIITTDSAEGIVPFTVNFTGSTFYLPDSGTCLWNFGDDSTSTEQNPSHTYKEAGTYTVSLTKFYDNKQYDTVLVDYITVHRTNPIKTKLSQNYPNPFNSETTIKYELSENVFVRLNIYNLKGQLVKKVIFEDQLIGYHSIKINANDLSSGMYFYRIQAGNFNDCKKFLLIK